MNERRIARLEQQIKARIAQIIVRDMADPRLGFITITKVKLDRELATCKVYWSALGDEKERRLQEHLLAHARKFVQHEVAEILTTRTMPQLRFVYDESIEGALRVNNLIKKLADERAAKEAATGEPGASADAVVEGADAAAFDEDEDTVEDDGDDDEDGDDADDGVDAR
jgi:ribosome-binding factor A